MTHDAQRPAPSAPEQSSYTGPPSSMPGFAETSPPARRVDGWTRLHIVAEGHLFAAENQRLADNLERIITALAPGETA